jgi:hypothetical protein
MSKEKYLKVQYSDSKTYQTVGDELVDSIKYVKLDLPPKLKITFDVRVCCDTDLPQDMIGKMLDKAIMAFGEEAKDLMKIMEEK